MSPIGTPKSRHPVVSLVILIRAVVDGHHAHPFNRLRCLLGYRGFSAQGRLHLGPPFGGMKVRTTSMMRPISASKPGAVHGALVLAGDLVELEGGSVIDPSTDLVRNLELLIGTGRT